MNRTENLTRDKPSWPIRACTVYTLVFVTMEEKLTAQRFVYTVARLCVKDTSRYFPNERSERNSRAVETVEEHFRRGDDGAVRNDRDVLSLGDSLRSRGDSLGSNGREKPTNLTGKTSVRRSRGSWRTITNRARATNIRPSD